MSQTIQAEALPAPQYTQTRSSPRAFVILPATISFGSDGEHYPGLIRDISQTGIFFYCDVKPELQSEVNVVVRVGEAAAIAYKGRVVRVEEPSAGAAVGVAIQILRDNEASGLTD
jgi:PilZ domain